MAQTGFTPIQLYYSSTTTNAPLAANLASGELAINITDGKLFYKDNANAVQVIGWKTVPTTAGGTGLTSYTAGDLTYYASGTALTKLGIGTAYYMLGVNSGGTAPSWQPSSTSVLTAQGDLLYASAANTLARLAKNTTANRYLSNSGSSNNPAWAQIDLTNGVTGTLPTVNGGTGLTTFTSTGVLYASSTSALATSSNFTFDGTNVYAANIVAIGGSPLAGTKLDVYQDLGGIGDGAYFKDTGSAYGAGAVYIRFVNNAGATAGSIQHTASTVTVYNTVSDARLKENIVDAPQALEKILTIPVRSYDWKEDNVHVEYGFIAQEINEVYSEPVSVGKDDEKQNPWSLEYGRLTPILVKAFQELNAKIEALETKLKNSGVTGF